MLSNVGNEDHSTDDFENTFENNVAVPKDEWIRNWDRNAKWGNTDHVVEDRDNNALCSIGEISYDCPIQRVLDNIRKPFHRHIAFQPDDWSVWMEVSLQDTLETLQRFKKEPKGNLNERHLVTNTQINQSQTNNKVTNFVASPDLMLAWVKGYNVQLEAENKPKLNEETVLASPDYFHELERSIDKIISNYGRLKSYTEKRYHFTFGGKIFSPIESLIADDLFLPPRSAVDFLDILLKDIFEQTVNGAVFSGNWGELLIDENNELSFYLIKRRSKKLSKVLKG